MPRKLSSEESLWRYVEARELWNGFDPLGVTDVVDDEYEMYVGPSLRLVIEGYGVDELEEYVRWVVYDRMGLSETEKGNKADRVFAEKFIEWYRTKWPDTTV